MQLYSLVTDVILNLRSILMGKILTIIDASISDPEQRKGIKDLMRDAIWNNNDWEHDRLRIIISEFNEKFAKINVTPDEAYFLETGMSKRRRK